MGEGFHSFVFVSLQTVARTQRNFALDLEYNIKQTDAMKNIAKQRQ